MIEQNEYGDWVDRYVRDELSEDEIVVFEEQLLEDVELQHELEAVLVLIDALKLDSEGDVVSIETAETRPGRNQWSVMAIAASVLLAVVSTTFYWKTSVEAGYLREQLASLQAPRTAVLRVSLDIMRSAGAGTPDVIVQKPNGQGAIVLDIELAERFQKLDSIQFQLQTDKAVEIISWTAPPDASGRVSVILNTENIPGGMVYLLMSDATGELSERRLLEFR